MRLHGNGSWYAHAATWVIGVLIGFGQTLIAERKLTVPRIVGQVLVSGGLGASSGALLLLIPDAPMLAVLGVSAAIASLGATALEQILLRIIGRDKS